MFDAFTKKNAHRTYTAACAKPHKLNGDNKSAFENRKILMP